MQRSPVAAGRIIASQTTTPGRARSSALIKEEQVQLLATHHIAVITPNMQEMERFYTETLGFPVTKRWEDAGIIFIDVGSTQIELIGRDNMEGEERPHSIGQGVGINHIALQVLDTDEAFQELQQKGVPVLREPTDFQTVRIAFFSDPDGNVLELVQDLETA
ncbi:MAG: VOC family protein, partial [Chloroflexota bacterium]|nr:VOC family protein [Chloroflexota bacterium]